MSIWRICEELNADQISFIMVTMIQVRGSAPQDLGAKMIVTAKGLHYGTVGGGKVEEAAKKRSLEILQSENTTPEIKTWNLQTDIGMSCGGEVSFLFEHHRYAHWPIVIFGAGHVAQALTRVVSKLSSSVTCIDSRQEWISKLEGVKAICHENPSALVKTFDPKSYFICMTMGHSFDVPILLEIFKHAPNTPYVGVIGSDVKGIKIKNELKSLGASDEFLLKLKIPIGLPIGTNRPYEIAVSVCAELLQVRDLINQSHINKP